MTKMKLFGEPSWRSAIIETQLVWYDMPFDFLRVGDLFAAENNSSELETLNPLKQIPTLVLTDGSVMTESAAITLWLADQAASSGLVPEPNAEERAGFLRWLIFITSNIYPTYTYADDPSRFVEDKSAQDKFEEALDRYVKKLYLLLNAQASGPWFLGQRFSALDIYICTMTHWGPGLLWFAENTPALLTIAEATTLLPRLSETWARNFPEE